MEVVTDQECASAGPIQLPDSITVDPTCNTLDSIFTRFLDISCQAQYVESQLDAILESEEECDQVIDSINNICSVNEEGEYCELTQLLLQDDDFDAYHDALINCNDTSTCDPLCTLTLNSITSCCFITEFNGTFSQNQYDWLSYEFWSRCDLRSPGFCETKFTNGATTDTNGATTNTNGATIFKAPAIWFIFTVALVVLRY